MSEPEITFENAPIAAAALAAVREQRSPDMQAVQDALAHLRETSAQRVSSRLLADLNTRGLFTSSQLIARVVRDAGLRTNAQALLSSLDTSGATSSVALLAGSLKTISDAHAASTRKAFERFRITPEWDDSIRATLELITRASDVAVPDYVTKGLAEYPRLIALPAFRAAVAEAEAAAAREARPTPDAAARSPLSAEQARAMQAALLGAIAACASAISSFVGSKDVEKAVVLFQFLVALVVLYHACAHRDS